MTEHVSERADAVPARLGAMTTSEPARMTITLPGDVHFFRAVRLAVGGIAAHVGFDVAAIDDLRIGVDELCAALAEVGGGAEITLEVVIDAGSELRISGTTVRSAEGIDSDRLQFSRQILDVVADEFSLDLDGGDVRFWLARRVSPLEAEPNRP
jgi:anti-sigma regulatory factor (Ser/Thr protein kinase)